MKTCDNYKYFSVCSDPEQTQPCNGRETEAEALAKKIREKSVWNLKQLKELCKLADMETEWNNATAEEFEAVVFKAAKKLGVEIL